MFAGNFPFRATIIILLLHGCFTFVFGEKVKKQKICPDSLMIHNICSAAKTYLLKYNNAAAADSISEIAITHAAATYDNKLILESLNEYLESTDHTYNYKKSEQYALQAEQLAGNVRQPEIRWRTYQNIAATYRAGFNYDKAVTFSFKAFDIASNEKDPAMKAKSHISIGQSLEGKNQKLEAFRNFLLALNISQSENDKKLLIECYDNLSKFYTRNKIFDKATEYRLKQIELIRQLTPIDSVALLWSQYELEVNSFLSNKKRMNSSNVEDILEYAHNTNNIRLKNHMMALYRTYLIESMKFNSLKELYLTRYPAEFSYLQKNDTIMYLRLKAFFAETEGRIDSADFYFQKAEAGIRDHANVVMLSNFYIRYGQFMYRHNELDKAIDNFLKAYRFAVEGEYFDYMLESSKYLDTLFYRTGDYKNAHLYAGINRSLTDSLSELTRRDELFMLEIDNIARLNEISLAQRAEQTRRKHNLQYMIIVVLIATTFIFLAMLGSFTVPSWYIRIFGFFAFIFLFEFIILLIDHRVHRITHGEPWKVLLIKIGVIAFLLPLHHWLEKRVTTYLARHKLIDFSTFSLKKLRTRIMEAVKTEA